MTSKMNMTKYKTEPCKHFLRGNCEKGDDCSFIHKSSYNDTNRNAKASLDRISNELKIAEGIAAYTAKVFKASYNDFEFSKKNVSALKKSYDEAKALVVKAQPKQARKFINNDDDSDSILSFNDMMERAKSLTCDNE